MSAANAVAALLLLAVGALHLLPVIGVLGPPRLQQMYGVTVDDPSLAILLRHRAVLFAIVGGVLVIGAAHAPWRMLALTVGLISVLSFLLLAKLEGGGNDAIQNVVRMDIAALLGLLAVAAIEIATIQGRH